MLFIVLFIVTANFLFNLVFFTVTLCAICCHNLHLLQCLLLFKCTGVGKERVVYIWEIQIEFSPSTKVIMTNICLELVLGEVLITVFLEVFSSMAYEEKAESPNPKSKYTELSLQRKMVVLAVFLSLPLNVILFFLKLVFCIDALYSALNHLHVHCAFLCI